jgi:SAM-dependent methyltransferase
MPGCATDAMTSQAASQPLAFTGERFVPGVPGEIAHEHRHRYAFARRFVAGRRVADVAAGEGYGSALLATAAAEVIGIDIDAATIAHASAVHRAPNVRFATASAAALPLADASVDAVVSFETIEHLPQALQPAMLREFARVLAPGGRLIISSPNRPLYSEARHYHNPFHQHELDRAELAALLAADFPAQRWFHQRRYLGSAVWREDASFGAREGAAATVEGLEALAGDDDGITGAHVPEALYFIVIAAREPAALPADVPGLSLYTDVDDREWARLDAQAAEVLRLDALLRERDATVARQQAHVVHLEGLVAYRDRIVAERDAQLHAAREAREHMASRVEPLAAEVESLRRQREALDAERTRLEGAVAAQERIIAYRQSARWWVLLPWVRIRRLWQRLT